MKAVVTIAPQKSLVKEIEKPVMNDDSVMIKLKYCGVCYSEHYDWKHNGGTFGHEPMGVIVEVGKNVKGYAVGDRVSGLWGSTLPGAGGMVQYAVADPAKSTIVKLADNLRDEDAVLEPLACLYSAVSKVSCSMPGTRVCVVGCGYMGCGAISLLKVRGCYVVAVDIRESSRQDALRYGADEVYSPEEALEKFCRHDTMEEAMQSGFETVMEWAETNESLDTAIKLTKTCGQLCIGAYHTGEKRLVDMQMLNIKAIDMLSTHPRQQNLSDIGARNAARMLASGEWNFHHIPTMVYPMNMFDQAQADLETKYGHHMKALINMEMEDGEPYLV
jgi:threonine dehydrogenase-like Zn-dependent dehydrogenase